VDAARSGGKIFFVVPARQLARCRSAWSDPAHPSRHPAQGGSSIALPICSPATQLALGGGGEMKNKAFQIVLRPLRG